MIARNSNDRMRTLRTSTGFDAFRRSAWRVPAGSEFVSLYLCRTWIFPFASLVLRYENGLSDAEKRDGRGLYRSGKYDPLEDKEDDDGEMDGEVRGKRLNRHDDDDPGTIYEWVMDMFCRWEPPTEDKDKYWSSVFYEIEVTMNKEKTAEEERRRVYKSEHKAVIEKIDECLDKYRERKRGAADQQVNVLCLIPSVCKNATLHGCLPTLFHESTTYL